MKLNKKASLPALKTHNGGKADRISLVDQLRRTVMTTMLWENSYYEDGVAVADRIASLVKDLVAQNKDNDVYDIAVRAREEQNLRHVPLLLARELTRHGSKVVASLLERIIQRPDELTEFIAIYQKDDDKQPFTNQVKKGLARAMVKFNEYSFAKYNRKGAVTLKDVLFISHAKPKEAVDVAGTTIDEIKKKGGYTRGKVQRHENSLFQKIVDDTLTTPDTWEVRLSASKGEDKGRIWQELIQENKLGALAFLRNLRNMQEQKVPMNIIREGIMKVNTERVLPFRFISAAKHAPELENQLEELMFRGLEKHEKLKGKTVLLVDKSGSMSSTVSGKSEISRYDAGVALSMLLREICDDPIIFTFNDDAKQIKQPRRGFALRDLMGSVEGGTNVGQSIRTAYSEHIDAERIIVITDEQSSDNVTSNLGCKGYMINVANYENGIGYKGDWTHINGWSESIVDFIQELEKNFNK